MHVIRSLGSQLEPSQLLPTWYMESLACHGAGQGPGGWGAPNPAPGEAPARGALQEWGPGRRVRVNPNPPKPPVKAGIPASEPTLSPAPRLQGGSQPGRQRAIPGPTPPLIIFHDEHVIMSYTRNNQFGITTLMS